MRSRISLLPLLLVALVQTAHSQDFESRLKPPLSNDQENLKFHKPDVTGTPADVRLAGYVHRLQMEAESPFGNVKWRSVGPDRQGGRVIDILSPKSKPNTLYVAFATGGLWRTETDGSTWEPLFDHEGAFAIGSVAMTDDGNTIWVGTGENNAQRTGYAGMGIYKSTDAGKSWQNMGLAETHRIGKVLIDPHSSNVVYVAAQGHLYSENPERGVYKTTDGGKTWAQILTVDKYTGAIDMQMDPRDPNVIYAATWQFDRRAWDYLDGGPGSAIYKTTNGGKNWTKLENGLPTTHQMSRIGLAICPSKPDSLYAFIDNHGPLQDTIDQDEVQPSGILTPHRFVMLSEDEFVLVPKPQLQSFFNRAKTKLKVDDALDQVKNKKMTMDQLRAKLAETNEDLFREETALAEVYRSDDGGKHWHKTDRIGNHGGYYYDHVFVNPTNPDEVYTCGVEMLKSVDGGKSWKIIARRTHSDDHVYYIDPRNPHFHALGTDGGIYLSYDSGEHWRHIENMPVGQFTTVAVDNKIPYNIYGGLQDNGTMKGPSTYVGGVSDPELWSAIGGGDGSAIAVDPRDGGDTVYLASQFGEGQGFDQKGHDRWGVRPTAASGQPPLRYNWVSPIVVSPHHGDIIYFGTNKLHRSLDQGRTWEDLSGDLTKNLPNGNVPFSTIRDISESPVKFGVVYVGCDDGTVKITKNHGDTWQDISTPMPNVWVTHVVASKYDKATVYVTQSGYREDDYTPYVWKSTDYGKHWNSIAANLPPEPVNVIREDPTKKDLLYLGTDMGVFLSYDGGKTWIALSGGIPHVPVHDLAVQERDKELVAGTHGRSVWVLKLDKIYDLNDGLKAKDLVVFPLENMTRNQRWGYGSAGNLETDKTPPAPQLAGEIWAKTAGPATISLKSKDGKVVIQQNVTLLTGYNAFALSLQTAPSRVGTVKVGPRQLKSVNDVLADPFESLRAQYVAAGDYTVEVSSNGKTASTKWTLEKGT